MNNAFQFVHNRQRRAALGGQSRAEQLLLKLVLLLLSGLTGPACPQSPGGRKEKFRGRATFLVVVLEAALRYNSPRHALLRSFIIAFEGKNAQKRSYSVIRLGFSTAVYVSGTRATF